MFSKIKKLGMEVSEATGLAHGGSSHRSQARSLMSSGDYVKALKQLNLSLDWVPDDDDSYFLRGQCHDHLHQDQEAIEDYTQAIRLSKQHSPKTAYHQKRGDCYMRLHRYSEALSDYNDALQTGPVPPDYLLEYQIDYSRLQSMQEQAKQALAVEEAQKAERQAAAEADRQRQAQEQQERARLEQAQREALEAAREKSAQEAEHQRLAAEKAARHGATLYMYTRIGNWLPDDVAEVFEALSEDYVQEIVGCRSHLVIEDEQRIRSQVKEIGDEEEAPRAAEAKKQAEAEIARQAEIARVALENHQWLAARAFGAEKWNKYFGDVGAEPPLPPNIREILLAPCPIWPGKRVEETHKLVLVPKTVNGAPLTLTRLGELVKAPKEGHKTQYRYCLESVKKLYGEMSPAKAHWVLMAKDVIPGIRHKLAWEQRCLVDQLGGGYAVPLALDAAVVIFMEYVETGVRLFSGEPVTFTYCQEEAKPGYRVAVGCFASSGLGIESEILAVSRAYGVAPARKFC